MLTGHFDIQCCLDGEIKIRHKLFAISLMKQLLSLSSRQIYNIFCVWGSL